MSDYKGTQWKPGPLPPDTWGWGGVVTKETPGGFYYADFCGDYVMNGVGERIEGKDVIWYTNPITEVPS